MTKSMNAGSKVIRDGEEVEMVDVITEIAESIGELDSRGGYGTRADWDKFVRPQIASYDLTREQEIELWEGLAEGFEGDGEWKFNEVKWLMEVLKIPEYRIKNTKTA